MRGNRITTLPLDVLRRTDPCGSRRNSRPKTYEKAMDLRSTSFREAFRTLRTIIRARPHTPPPDHKPVKAGGIELGFPGTWHEHRRPGCRPPMP
jgi:hypothetical protein